MTDRDDWRDRVRHWSANHFSMSDEDANASRLLRRVADALDQLGEVEVFDVIFSQQVEGSSATSKATVYFAFPDQERDFDGTVDPQ